MPSSFVQSPQYNNWFQLFKPEKSLLICSPYLKKYAIDKIIKEYKLDNLVNGIEIDIMIRGRFEDFINGSSDLAALEVLKKLENVQTKNVSRVTNLHMKAYMIDEDKLLIGSGNCTQRGLFGNSGYENVEGAISTTDKEIINDFKNYYLNISQYSEQMEYFYGDIAKQITNYNETVNQDINIGNKILSAIKKNESKARYNLKIHEKNEFRLKADMIPQFSNFEQGAYEVVDILLKQENLGLTFVELGILLEGSGKNDGAYRKYGENHAKLAEFLDLVTITNTRPRKIYVTELGRIFYGLNNKKKKDIIKSQIYRMDIVKFIIENYSNESFNLSDELLKSLEKSTVNRRLPNIRALFKFLEQHGVSEARIILEKL